MKLKSILPLLMLFALSGCHSFDDYIYEAIEMTLSNADNSGLTPVDASGSAPILAYAIKVDYTMHITESGDTDRYESGFRNEDEVTSFTISSPDSFNLVAPNNSLNHFFNYSTGSGTGNTISEDNYSRYASGGIFFTEGTNPKPDWNISHYLMLMNPPETTGNYTFVLDIEFSDGRQLIESVQVNLY